MSKVKDRKGRVYWLTGLSGAGKTTIGKALHEYLQKFISSPVVFLDGDELRSVFDLDNVDYSLEERKKIALRNGRLCKFLADQGLDVVCATISLFHQCQDWNRTNISNYYEIYIQSPLNELEKRDPKQIYAKAKVGLIKNVAGLDLPVDFPKNPDLILNNDGSKSIEELLQIVLQQFCLS